MIEDYFLEDEEEDIATAIRRGSDGRTEAGQARKETEEGGGRGVKGWDKVRRHLLPGIATEVKVGGFQALPLPCYPVTWRLSSLLGLLF